METHVDMHARCTPTQVYPNLFRCNSRTFKLGVKFANVSQKNASSHTSVEHSHSQFSCQLWKLLFHLAQNPHSAISMKYQFGGLLCLSKFCCFVMWKICNTYIYIFKSIKHFYLSMFSKQVFSFTTKGPRYICLNHWF